MTTPDRLTLSVKETADLLGVSHTTVYEAIKKGTFPHIKIGKRIRVSKAQLETLLQGSI